MADDDDDTNPFSGIPFLGDIASILGSGSETRWDGARQTAVHLATGGRSEPNVDPVQRHRLGEIVRVAELHVANVTGLDPTTDGRPPRTDPVTRSMWANDAVDAIRPLMDRLADRLSAGEDTGTPSLDPFEGLLRMISPMMVAMSAGMMAGQLATRALGNSDLAVPRWHDVIRIIPSNITDFALEWSLEVDDVTLWVAIREHAMHSVLSVPGVHAELDGLLHDYVDGFHRSVRSLEELASLDALDMTSLDLSTPESTDQMHRQLQQIFGNPELLLGVSRDDAQSETVARLETLLSVLVAYVDDVIEQAGSRLIGGFPALREALRRRQVAAKGEEFADRLLGVRISPDARHKGRAFVAGVIERAGRESLAHMWETQKALPTPNDMLAPGLWLARIDIEQP
ncbi:zinc-dependent metalloprotease [Candidatus Poriferisodalis sp.]|uniref:zinc-dependent metalloprotease n=1 Tax=Candidatus Poriferisodalis sp. TaxID=3101277 RepID=UPI003D1322AB